jgi:hypothetical protein
VAVLEHAPDPARAQAEQLVAGLDHLVAAIEQHLLQVLAVIALAAKL